MSEVLYDKDKIAFCYKCKQPLFNDDKIINEIDNFESYFRNDDQIAYERKNITCVDNQGTEYQTSSYIFTHPSLKDPTKLVYLPTGSWKEYALANNIN